MINIVDKYKCSGCHACESKCPKNCIEMCSDEEGFLYPKVNDTLCIECRLCEKICPIINNQHNEIIRKPKTYAAYNKNLDIRLKSSSGGVFTVIAEYVIKRNGVVFGACFDQKFNLIHDYAKTIEGLEKFRTSKYVQSRIGNTFKIAKEFLDEGKIVLFTGTPCQIGGLYSFLGKRYDNLLTQDIICHGVPSPKIWNKYVEFIEEREKSKLIKFSYRCKKYGWQKNSIYLRFKNGCEYIESINKNYAAISFYRNINIRPSCIKCSFKNINRQSDITLADFWGIEKIYPEMNDDKGTSLMIVNSQKGIDIFKEIDKDIIFKECNLKDALRRNASMIKSTYPHANREKFYKRFDELGIEKSIKKYAKKFGIKNNVSLILYYSKNILIKIKTEI